MSDCIFCNIVAGQSDATFVYQDDVVSAFMDLLPINPGHLLVIPNDHASSLSDLDPVTGAQIWNVAQRIAAAIRESDLKCEGVNLILQMAKRPARKCFIIIST